MNNKLLHTLSMLLLAMVAFTFTSCSLSDLDEIDGHRYVDLGLSVKWATCNVGADSPDDYGDYFAWGETQPKSTYNRSTYKWNEGDSGNLTKYCNLYYFGTVDNKIQLDLSDDAAHVNWGGNWRMPTYDEWKELRDKCTWTWRRHTYYYDDEAGFEVTSKINGNSIFLPAAGYREDGSLYDAGSKGCYWSSSLRTSFPYEARSVDFSEGRVESPYPYPSRLYGFSVRPVCP